MLSSLEPHALEKPRPLAAPYRSMKRMKRSHSCSLFITTTPFTMRGLPLTKFAVT